MTETIEILKGKKFLTNRKEIAKAINIDHLPVIVFDLTNPMEYENCYEGSKVSVTGAYKGKYSYLACNCTAHLWGDKESKDVLPFPWLYKKVYLNCWGVGISSSFSLRDVEEMIEWSHAPKMTANDKVVVYFKDGKNLGYLRLMKVGAHLDPHCSTVAVLEDVE